MVLDKDNFAFHLEHLKKYLSHIRYLREKYAKNDFVKNWQVEDQILRKLQLSIECMLDMGDLIINGFGFRKPETYADIPRILEENKVISKELSGKLIRLAKFRNVLVHDYLYLDQNKVFSQFETIAEKVEEFAGNIKEFLKIEDEYAKNKTSGKFVG
jgi:uncharacterized protein YutE (UPF0331/DUF86 family)